MNVEYNLKEDSNKESNNEEQQKKGRNGFWNGLLAGVLLSALVVSGTYTVRQLYNLHQMKIAAESVPVEEESDTFVSDEIMWKMEFIEDTISRYYYQKDIDKDAMTEGVYKGMVKALGDQYSCYYTETELTQLMEQTEGIYYGIGAYVSMDQRLGFAKVSGVIENTPAEEAGLREGDIIYQVDGEVVQEQELSEIVAKIKGLEGTTVHLTIVREEAEDYLEFDIERRKIESPTVSYEMYENQTGYIQITEFDDVTKNQFVEAMAALNEQGMKGLILDLRANPGGNLNTVVEIARELLPKGLVVYTEDRNGKREEYFCDGTKQFKLPLVVLVNGNSASASEILAGAIQDYGIGELIGTTTFGKGIVQRVVPLSDNTALKLTVSSYFTPNGNNIHGVGIEPDEVYEFDGERYYGEGYDNQLEHAKEVIGKKIEESQ